MNSENARRKLAKRVERAHRILDAAGKLILRWGYDRTTIDDIARESVVAKGTIYLHWRTRDDLFRTLIKREKLALAEAIRRRVIQDPAGATLQGLLRDATLALVEQPLLKAILLNDMDVLGKLARTDPAAAPSAHLVEFSAYLEILRDAGLLRTDLDPRAQLFIFSATFMGCFLTNSLMPPDYRYSDEEIAALVAETAHRTLEAERRVSPAELAAVSQAFLQYLDHALATARDDLRRDLESAILGAAGGDA